MVFINTPDSQSRLVQQQRPWHHRSSARSAFETKWFGENLWPSKLSFTIVGRTVYDKTEWQQENDLLRDVLNCVSKKLRLSNLYLALQIATN